jgi:hypothetical protein
MDGDGMLGLVVRLVILGAIVLVHVLHFEQCQRTPCDAACQTDGFGNRYPYDGACPWLP